MVKGDKYASRYGERRAGLEDPVGFRSRASPPSSFLAGKTVEVTQGKSTGAGQRGR
jgi:hypothetical protein